MKYIKLLNGIPENYTLEQLLIDFPNAIIYKKTKLPNEELIKEFNVYPYRTMKLRRKESLCLKIMNGLKLGIFEN
jgi:hypothetical protein